VGILRRGGLWATHDGHVGGALHQRRLDHRQPSQTDKGHIFARKGDKALNIDITEHKGGPNAGRVSGSVLDSSR